MTGSGSLTAAPPRETALALTANFLGPSPAWYKVSVVGFLVLNPVVLILAGPFATGWLLMAEFIYTLAMALKCYPLQPGGLLAVEAVVLGLTTPDAVYQETVLNLPVILLLTFMVAGIYFLKDLLLLVFARVLLGIRSKVALSVFFCAISASLSAFLDALTVTAVIITMAVGFYEAFHKIASGKQFHDDHDATKDHHVVELHREDLERFRGFLRSLTMHGAVGTALGGMTTLVGEPQNLLIGRLVGWEFMQFFLEMAPLSLPVFAVGLLTCAALERTRCFGFGEQMTENVRIVLTGYAATQSHAMSHRLRARLIVQAALVAGLVFGLAFHVAEAGLIGLAVIVLATAFNGVIEVRNLGRAFREALPFTALLVTFFSIVAVIQDQQLFDPVIAWALGFEEHDKAAAFYLASGALSAVSDNVFVATIYITELVERFDAGTISRAAFEELAIAINAGTNLISVATPNGQAAFIFLLTSALAPVIRLSYARMVWMAMPYALVMTSIGLVCLMRLK
jgi:Na+:H+ antiporter, NhaB family